jgi:cell pole-organizing protein PopZ
MAQPNVAREPSMDEILASIRKIIESNEPGIPGFPANDLGPAPADVYRSYDDDSAEDIHLTIDDDVLAAEFEAEEQKHAPSVEHQPPQEQQEANAKPAIPTATPPLSLADVAARVRAASERHSAPLREPETATVRNRPDNAARSDNPMITARMAPASPFLPQQAETVQVSTPAASIAAAPQTAVTEEKNQSTQAAVAVERPAEQPPIAVVADKVAVAERDIATIVSPAVGEQVARSFGDLALAVDSSARRSFDEIAEDMLRPMLQEWLDDNLPTLVERLVREEIERVARGPRR